MTKFTLTGQKKVIMLMVGKYLNGTNAKRAMFHVEQSTIHS